MTDRLANLIALKEAVEAGDDAAFRSANRAVFSTPCQDMALQMREGYARYAYKGSISDAKALHEAVLPGWAWLLGNNGSATVLPKSGRGTVCKIKDNPARGWLMAILSALIERERQP